MRPFAARANRRALCAVALSVCKKFNAARSALNNARALPATSQTKKSRATSSPSRRAPNETRVFIKHEKTALEPRRAAKRGRRATNQIEAHRRRPRHKPRRQIAAADIFAQSASDIGAHGGARQTRRSHRAATAAGASGATDAIGGGRK